MHKPNQAEAAVAAMDPKPARRRKTEDEQLAELEQQRLKIERKRSAIKAIASLEAALKGLRALDFHLASEGIGDARSIVRQQIEEDEQASLAEAVSDEGEG